MSELKKKDLHTPFNNLSIIKILSHLFKGQSEQATAADAELAVPGMAPTTQSLMVYDAYAMLTNACASGESISFDIKVDGSSILTEPLVLDDTSDVKTQLRLSVDPAKRFIPRGSIVTVVRDYTAGGAPTPITNTKCVIEAYPA